MSNYHEGTSSNPELSQQVTATNAVIIAGMASKAANLAPLALLASHFAPERVAFVDGGIERNKGTWVASPSEQIIVAQKQLEDLPQGRTILISHSLGALAALHLLEENSPELSVVALSPPLLAPSSLLVHPRLLSRLQTTKDGRSYIPSYSYAHQDDIFGEVPDNPVPVNIAENYAEDIYEHGADFAARSHNMCEKGLLRFIIADEDWNQSALIHGPQFKGTLFMPGIHSFQADKEIMEKTMQTIYDTVVN